MENLERILAEHPFLQGLAQEHIQLIAGCASNVRFNAGDYIFRDGDAANAFYIIRQGRVALELHALQRGTVTIQSLGEGEIIGWSWLIPPYEWRFDARAVELTRAIALDGKCLRTKCEQDHHLGYELLKRFSNILGQRLDTTVLQLLDLYGTTV